MDISRRGPGTMRRGPGGLWTSAPGPTTAPGGRPLAEEPLRARRSGSLPGATSTDNLWRRLAAEALGTEPVGGRSAELHGDGLQLGVVLEGGLAVLASLARHL